LKTEWKKFALMAVVFIACYFLPVGRPRFDNAVMESLGLVRWYAREHVVYCLIPAFFIAGAIAVFINKSAVLKYLGPKANKPLAYGVASVSGSILAVCSCTVLPLFAGIYRMGAGLGPASAFLYAGPAINVLAIVLTAKVLGLHIGIARAFGAIVFSLAIGLLMHAIFGRKEHEEENVWASTPEKKNSRSLRQNAIYFLVMVGILVFANWGKPVQQTGLWYYIYLAKWLFTGFLALMLAVILVMWFNIKVWKMIFASAPVIILACFMPHEHMFLFGVGIVGFSILTGFDQGECGEWFRAAWDFAKQIMPLLFLGVLFAGLMLGRPGHDGLIPSHWVTVLVGGNSIRANLFASVAGALMYFATLTEVPVLRGLMDGGMGNGPALALLLAGPALSLPSMLVIHSVIGAKRTIVYVLLVSMMAAISGIIYGFISG